MGVPVMAGETLNKRLPVPLSSVTAAARLAEVGVARNVAMPVPRPYTSLLIANVADVVSVPLPLIALTKPLVERAEKLGVPLPPMAKRFTPAVTSSNRKFVPDVAMPKVLVALAEVNW